MFSKTPANAKDWTITHAEVLESDLTRTNSACFLLFAAGCVHHSSLNFEGPRHSSRCCRVTIEPLSSWHQGSACTTLAQTSPVRM